MTAILDGRNRRRYDDEEFTHEVVDLVTDEDAKRVLGALVDGYRAREAGQPAAVASVTLSDGPGIPGVLQGARFDLVNGPPDRDYSLDQEYMKGIRVRIDHVHTLGYLDLG